MVNFKHLLLFLSSVAVYANAAIVVPNPETPGGPIVDLGYSVYQGETLPNGVNQWLGLRYGAPPIGNLRFRKPQPPANTSGIIQANNFGPVCFGLGNGIGAKYGEDCLFLNLWGPSKITLTSKFPVFFWLSGGAYLRIANANYNGSELVAAADHDMIYIGINYRVGPFGFLASQDVSVNGQMDLNVGLHDQLLALRWIKQNIGFFGGDPGQVVIVGDSAGGGSIAIHLIAHYPKPETLFHGIMGLSPYFPAQFRIEDLQFQFNQFSERVGCGGFNVSSEKLACLRSQDGYVLQAANGVSFTFPGESGDSADPWTPCIDHDLLTDFPLALFAQGKYRKMPSIFGHDTNEGSIFAVNANTTQDIANFFLDNFPGLNTTDTDNIIAHYPLMPPKPMHGPWFPSASAAFGDTVLACQAIALSSYLAPFADTWNYRYNVNTPSQEALGIDVYHQCELPPLYGKSNAMLPQFQPGPESFNMTPFLQKYYTNFVRFLDPNEPSVNQTWPQWKPSQLIGTSGTRLVFSLNESANFEPVIGFEKVSDHQLSLCAFWRTLENKMGQ